MSSSVIQILSRVPSTFPLSPFPFLNATIVLQLHTGRDLTDNFLRSAAFHPEYSGLISCQRSTKTRLAGSLLLGGVISCLLNFV